MTDTPMIPWSLDEAMEHVAERAVKFASEGEASFQTLNCFDEQNQLSIVALNVGPGAQIAWFSRAFVNLLQPRLAILETEGWVVRVDLTEGAVPDPDVKRALDGDIRISELPREKRGETLILYGESISGDKSYRMWELLSSGPPDFTRTGIKPSDLDQATSVHSRFEPLFLGAYIMREINKPPDGTPADAQFEALRRLAREIVRDEGEASAVKHVQNAVNMILAKGMGFSTREFDRWIDQARTQFRPGN